MIRSGRLVKQMISQARKSINHGKTTDYVAIILYEARMKTAKVQGSCYLCLGFEVSRDRAWPVRSLG